METPFHIQELGAQGDGVHLGLRGPIFIDRAVPGDEIRAQIYRDEDGIRRGKIVEILNPSPYRQTAPCVHYDTCGGCTLQHLKPEFYRQAKLNRVREALLMQGIRPQRWLTPVFLGDQNRRRATFATKRERNGVVMGYYQRRSDQISDIRSCLIANPKLLELQNIARPCLNEILGKEAVDVFFQLAGNTVDMVITGPVGRNGEPDDAVMNVLRKFVDSSPVTRVSWRPSERGIPQHLVSKGSVGIEFGEIRVALPPNAFLQPTPEGEAALVNAMMTALPSKGKFADLFSGCGTFTGRMLARGPVDAYESLPSAVAALSQAGTKKKSLRVFRRDLFRTPVKRLELNRYDAIVIDPPRSGCPEQMAQLASAKTGLVVAASCNPATFARDARILIDGGYWLQSVQVIDQFLWSHHVELVGVFTKKKRGRK